MSRTERIMVCLPENLLQEVDGIVSYEQCSRSELVRKAMRHYIQERRKEELQQRLEQGYKEMAGINLSIANEALEAENEVYRLIEDQVSGV